MTTHDELVAARRLELSDPRARHAQALCIALARCSRALLLYDPHNDAVAGFLDELRALAAEDHGELALEVGQHTFELDGQPVYLDRDNDRSLPFRLWRDGVRRLGLKPDAPWESWVRLIEILAVRMSRIRGDEDDVVSLVWRAELEGLRLEAVDGVVFGTRTGDGRRFDHHLPAPRNLDQPAPELEALGDLAFVPVAAADLASLRDELGPASTERDALRLGRLLLAAHLDGHVAPELLVTALLDLRDHLVREGRLRAVLELLAAVQACPGGARLHDVLLDTLTGRESLERLLGGVAPDDELLVEELVGLLDGLPGDPLAVLLDLLDDELGARALAVLRVVLARAARRDLPRLLHEVRTRDGQRAAQVLLALGDGAPEAARRLIVELAGHPDRAVQEARLALMETSPWGSALQGHLVAMLAGPDPAVRRAAALQLGRRGGPRAAPDLARAVEALGPHADRADAEVLGHALALTGAGAYATFEGWLRPKGLLARKVTGEAPRDWAAVAGLSHLRRGHTLLRELSLQHREPFRSRLIAAWRAHQQRFEGGG